VLGVSYEEAYQKAKVEKIPEWDALRTNAKITSFQMDYGAMAQSIANDTGIPLEDVEKIIEVDKNILRH
jgi:DNA polymerase I-like protein with 3'-5' exonuclease and polymerase domains